MKGLWVFTSSSNSLSKYWFFLSTAKISTRHWVLSTRVKTFTRLCSFSAAERARTKYWFNPTFHVYYLHTRKIFNHFSLNNFIESVYNTIKNGRIQGAIATSRRLSVSGWQLQYVNSWKNMTQGYSRLSTYNTRLIHNYTRLTHNHLRYSCGLLRVIPPHLSPSRGITVVPDALPAAGLHWLIALIKQWPLYLGLSLVPEIGSLFYKNNSVVSPLSGRTQFLVYTPEETLAIAQEQSDKILEELQSKNYEMLSPDREEFQRATGVVKRLLSYNPEIQEMTPHIEEFRVLLFNSDDIEVFSLSNGDIYLSRGLFDVDTVNDDTLAFTIAHELVHITMQHPMEILGNRVLLSHYAITVLTMLMGWTRVFDDDQQMFLSYEDEAKQFLSSLLKDVKSTLDNESILEYESDAFGFIFAVKANYDHRKFHEVVELTRTPPGASDEDYIPPSPPAFDELFKWTASQAENEDMLVMIVRLLHIWWTEDLKPFHSVVNGPRPRLERLKSTLWNSVAMELRKKLALPPLSDEPAVPVTSR